MALLFRRWGHLDVSLITEGNPSKLYIVTPFKPSAMIGFPKQCVHFKCRFRGM